MADYIYYVNPDAGAAGDGTTDSLSGTSCAYQTLNAAVTARAGTHGSGNTITYRCSGNGSNFIDSTAVDLSSHTEDSVIVEGYSGNYSGKNDGSTYDNTSYYALEVSTSTTHTLSVGVTNVTIRYLQCNNTSASNYYYTIYGNVGGSLALELTVDSCRVKSDKTNGTKIGSAVACPGGTGVVCINNVCEGNGNTNSANVGLELGSGSNGSHGQAYNNTVANFGVGVLTNNFFWYDLYNNAIVGCNDDWYLSGGEIITAGYNADSNDGDTPGSNNTTCVITDATDFTSPSTGDYTVYDTGSNLYDAGTTSGAPSDDITGTARGATYDIGAFEYVSGGTTESGTGSSAGTSTATGVGAAIISSSGTATSTGTATATGAAIATSTGSSAGTSTAAATGTAVVPSTGSSDGTSTAVAVALSTWAAIGAAVAAATAEAIGASTGSAAGASSGTATATAIGAATSAATGTATGTSTASAVGVEVGGGVEEAVGTATGTSTATGVAEATSAATGTSAATSTATGAAAATGAATGTATGAATAAAVGAATTESVGTSDGTSTATGAGAATDAAAGTSTATSTATGVAAATAITTGTATGTSTAEAVGAQTGIQAATGTAAGTSTATAVGVRIGGSLVYRGLLRTNMQTQFTRL